MRMRNCLEPLQCVWFTLGETNHIKDYSATLLQDKKNYLIAQLQHKAYPKLISIL